MDEKQRNELSAYLDGEAQSPDAIEQWLRQDKAAAQYVAELKQLSARLHGLPAPEVHPAFLTRVMARVTTERMEHPRPWARVWLPAATAVTLLLMGVGAYWMQAGSGQIPAPLERLSQASPEAIAKAIDTRIAAGGDPASLEPLSLVPDTAADLLPPNEDDDTVVLAALANWTPGVLDAAPDDNLESLVDSLSDDEAEALRTLIAEYVGKEGVS